MTQPIRNNATLKRFEQDVDGGTAFASYRQSPDALTIFHTEVPVAARGSGVGSRFVRDLLEEIRRLGLKVVPQCSFVRAFIANNPEFNDLLR